MIYKFDGNTTAFICWEFATGYLVNLSRERITEGAQLYRETSFDREYILNAIKMNDSYRSSLEMSTPTVWIGLSMLVLITDAKFLSIKRSELHPAVRCLYNKQQNICFLIDEGVARQICE